MFADSLNWERARSWVHPPVGKSWPWTRSARSAEASCGGSTGGLTLQNCFWTKKDADYEDIMKIMKILDDMNMIWDEDYEDYEDYEDSRWYEYDMNCSRMGI